MKYRKKPIVIEAIHYTGDWNSRSDVGDFLGVGYNTLQDVNCDGSILIKTLEGDMKAMPGDYIIKGVNGEFYPCKPDIFEKTYERVEE